MKMKIKKKVFVLILIFSLIGTIGISQIRTTKAYKPSRHQNFYTYIWTVFKDDLLSYNLEPTYFDQMENELENMYGTYESSIKNGLVQADTGTGYVAGCPLGSEPDYIKPKRFHGHHAYEHFNFYPFIGPHSAADWVQDLIDEAIMDYSSDKTTAYYKFGIALHLLQDLTVPHHAIATPFSGHAEYEQYIDDNWCSGDNIHPDAPNLDGIYRFDTLEDHYNCRDPWGWIDYAAHRSIDYWPYVNNDILDGIADNYMYAARNCLDIMTSLSAGFLRYFWERTHPNDDPDGDGLINHFERLIYNTDAFISDTDADGMTDGFEVEYGFDPLTYENPADPDGDNLTNQEECTHSTDPYDTDTDNDYLEDGWEIEHGFNPISSSDGLTDHDGDTITTGWEVSVYFTNWTNPDSDSDGLDDNWELFTYNSDPCDSDSDDDGLLDGEEVYTYGTDPLDIDSDNDMAIDGLEIQLGTNPWNPDTDGDGLSDWKEYFFGTNPLVNDSYEDPDNDGLSNYEEIMEYYTDPFDDDTDGGGMKDGLEVMLGKDPTDPYDDFGGWFP